MGKSILLTGGLGFLGSHLCQSLVANGYQVHLIVRGNVKLSRSQNKGKVNVYMHDGSIFQMIEIVANVKPSVIIHLAATVVSEHTPEIVDGLIQSNLLFGTQLLEAMRINNVKKIINTGTFWQYFNGDIGNPVSLYGATKQAFEGFLDFYVQAYDFQVISLILFDNYGPGDTRPKLFPLLKKSHQSLIPIDMSPGEQMIDMIHVDDLVNAYRVALKLLLAQVNPRHFRYSVSSGNPIKLRELVDLFILHSNLRPIINWGAKPYRHREVMIPWSGGKRLPGWRPNISLADGLKTL